MSTATISAPAERYLTRAEAALMLALEPQTLAKWAMDGRGPKLIKLNARVIRYRLSDLLAYIEASSVTA
jgi:predicted DNA-binding transcriptional regulator AlpA